MSELGFKNLRSDEGILVYNNNKQTIVAVVYVDDAFFCGPKHSLLVNKLKNAFMANGNAENLMEKSSYT
jgi:hypothetical protein